MTRQLEKAETTRDFIQGIIETLRQPFLVLDENMTIMLANESFYRLFHMTEKEVEGKPVYKLGKGEWDNRDLRDLLEEVLPKRRTFENFEMDFEISGQERKKMVLNARRIREHGLARDRILLAKEQITERGNDDTQ